MAEVIILRETEYNAIAEELSNMHSNQLHNVEVVIADLKRLVTSDDAFSTDLTSKKITDILDALSNDAIALLKQAFQDSEAGVANMITSTITTDSACG